MRPKHGWPMTCLACTATHQLGTCACQTRQEACASVSRSGLIKLCIPDDPCTPCCCGIKMQAVTTAGSAAVAAAAAADAIDKTTASPECAAARGCASAGSLHFVCCISVGCKRVVELGLQSAYVIFVALSQDG